jgi:hypothetical protein
VTEQPGGQAAADEMSERFAQFVIMQSQNILYTLGRIPGPGGEAVEPHFDVARMLIDQLEMVHHKTRGNLSREEEELLDNALSNMRLAFVETVNRGGHAPESAPREPAAPQPPPPKNQGGDDDEGQKRFSKSYG